jgi:cytochrome c-type biogenesis protein CcmF
MIVEIGHFALVLAFAAALAQTIVPFWGARVGDVGLMTVGRNAALIQLALIAVAFAGLVNAHLTSDFSVLNVAESSNVAMPAIYKISGVWGNHEGSMLLWVFILAIFGALVALFGRALPHKLRADALAVQGLISLAFLAFILLTSNPFERLSPAPFEGRDLNPILQDPGLAIHPPLLYLGYVGFSIVYSFAAAALIEGRIDAAWARFVRPFTLVAWSFLTLGITAGSFWAYYTLGWGGFWFWDPVENASLMPWLAGTAFVHSVAVMEKRDALKVWTIFLAILAFSFSLLGTFLVRSGVLTSVHAFANDPRRGVFILAILAMFICGSFALFAWRAPMLKQGGLFAPVSREGALVVNNLLLTTACATVLFGTLYPLALEQLTGEKITVGAPFFNLTCGVLLLTACFAAPFGFSLAWKRGDLLGIVQRLAFAIIIGAVTAIVGAAWLSGGSVFAPLAMGLGVFVTIGTLIEVVMRVWRPGLSAGVALKRTFGLPLSFFGAALAHFGLGVTLLGLSGLGFGAETIATLHKGVPAIVGPYSITLDSVGERVGPNYKESIASVTVRLGDAVVAEIAPARRQFAAREMSTTQAGLKTLHFGQIYVSIADPAPDGSVPARLYWKPLVTLIWLGGAAMALGGVLSLTDRRLRFGVAVRTKANARPLVQPAQ